MPSAVALLRRDVHIAHALQATNWGRMQNGGMESQPHAEESGRGAMCHQPATLGGAGGGRSSASSRWRRASDLSVTASWWSKTSILQHSPAPPQQATAAPANGAPDASSSRGPSARPRYMGIGLAVPLTVANVSSLQAPPPPMRRPVFHTSKADGGPVVSGSVAGNIVDAWLRGAQEATTVDGVMHAGEVDGKNRRSQIRERTELSVSTGMSQTLV